MTVLPKIGISLGDPAGIGPEITLKALQSTGELPLAHYILFGPRDIFKRESESLGITLDIASLPEISEAAASNASLFWAPGETEALSLRQGQPQKAGGILSFRAFEEGLRWAAEGRLNALVTAPISKLAWAMADLRWAGHTEYLSRIYPKIIMCFWSPRLKVALFSHHISLKKALDRIERNSLFHFFLRLSDSLPAAHGNGYAFLVAGLNPHAGEQGLIGTEEEEIISPAVQDARRKGLDIRGPFPPDVVFRMARNKPQTVVIALYHDQGLIPFKLEAFEDGVNLSLGLPFIRTSPDHGTAFDIAGQGKANPRSMLEALKLAYELTVTL